MVRVRGRKNVAYSLVLKNNNSVSLENIGLIDDLTAKGPDPMYNVEPGSLSEKSISEVSNQVKFYDLFRKIRELFEKEEGGPILLNLPLTTSMYLDPGDFYENNKIIVARSSDPASLDQCWIWSDLHYTAPPHAPLPHFPSQCQSIPLSSLPSSPPSSLSPQCHSIPLFPLPPFYLSSSPLCSPSLSLISSHPRLPHHSHLPAPFAFPPFLFHPCLQKVYVVPSHLLPGVCHARGSE